MSITGPAPVTGLGTPPAPNDDARLKKTAFQMEGMFVQKMFAAMRDTVPDDGLVSQNNAQDTFTSMLDEKMAEQVPTQWDNQHSLAEALYHQLRQRMQPPPATSTPDSNK